MIINKGYEDFCILNTKVIDEISIDLLKYKKQGYHLMVKGDSIILSDCNMNPLQRKDIKVYHFNGDIRTEYLLNIMHYLNKSDS
ncbi:hypothetical protein [Clostridium paraputrificum]|uniref:hypothetical protein n=1 Tax=Clostridium paraputrificum TaxID=29363 RepID=UPI000403E4BB|nr:hypothetical protein [Clostridium paraputrificum]